MLVNPEMYEESIAFFDPNSMQMQGGISEDSFSQTTPLPNYNPPTAFSMEQLSYHQQDASASASASASAAANGVMEIELEQQLAVEIEHCYNNTTTNHHHQSIDNTHVVQEVVCDESNWNTTHDFEDMNHSHYHQPEIQNGLNSSSSLPDTPYPDLLNLFHLPSSLLPNSSFSFANPTHKSANFPTFLGDGGSGSTVLYDPIFHLNLPPQPPLFRELFQSLPHGYNLNLPGSRTSSLFVEVDERQGSGGLYEDGDGSQYGNGVLKFSRDMNRKGKGIDGKGTKHFPTEKQRRIQLSENYKALRELVPNPTKVDRASIVGDAIEYIRELLRTVNELKSLVGKKRCTRGRMKRQKMEDDSALEVESNMKPHGNPAEQTYNGSSLRSSWLLRKSKNTEVDVRIIDDEVNIKLVQQKRINCLVVVSKILNELQLDLHHVGGGIIGDHYSFLFNAKICEGSSVYASAIANKLIEVVDRQYAATPPTSSY